MPRTNYGPLRSGVAHCTFLRIAAHVLFYGFTAYHPSYAPSTTMTAHAQVPVIAIERYRVEHGEGFTMPVVSLTDRRAAGNRLVRFVFQRHLETVLYGRSEGSSGPIWKVMNLHSTAVSFTIETNLYDGRLNAAAQDLNANTAMKDQSRSRIDVPDLVAPETIAQKLAVADEPFLVQEDGVDAARLARLRLQLAAQPPPRPGR